MQAAVRFFQPFVTLRRFPSAADKAIASAEHTTAASSHFSIMKQDRQKVQFYFFAALYFAAMDILPVPCYHENISQCDMEVKAADPSHKADRL